MSFEDSFSFKNENITQITLEDGVILQIAKLGPAVARVYFVDETQVEIPIPAHFLICDLSNGVGVNPIPGLNFFVLAWGDSYHILYRDQTVLSLRTQRQWSLAGPADRPIQAICEEL